MAVSHEIIQIPAGCHSTEEAIFGQMVSAVPICEQGREAKTPANRRQYSTDSMGLLNNRFAGFADHDQYVANIT